MVTRPTLETESLLTPAEVAAMFRVDPKTVTRWAKAGKLSAIRTLGGHRRYRESEVRAAARAGRCRPGTDGHRRLTPDRTTPRALGPAVARARVGRSPSSRTTRAPGPPTR